VEPSLSVAGATALLAPPTPAAVSPAWRFVGGWLAAWALVGFAVAAGIVFVTDVDFWPALQMSVLFAEVVGLTAFTSARVVFPLFARLPYALRFGLEILTVLSGTVFGSLAVGVTQPFFSLAQLRNVALIVLVNAVIAVVVAIALNTYDTMRRQIEASYLALREKEALERELGIAREVQRGLLPRSVPRIAGLQMAGVCLPAIGVGGDYYDFVLVDDDCVGLVIADVSGKGISAALLMAGIQASVRCLCRLVDDTGRLVSRLNEHLFQTSSRSRYATLFFGFYDAASRTLRYSNAGHHPPLLVHGGDVTRLDAERGLPMGMFDGTCYREGRQHLAAGDLIAFFTDGVTEAPSADGEEFGEQRLVELLRTHRDLDLDSLLQTVLDALTSWSGGTISHDDVTLVVARATR